jgi:anti-anti-sigma regulatory factor
MSSRLVVDVKGADRVAYLKLSGHIDEDNDLAELTKKITQPVVVLNSANVERINSCGVRDWVSWLAEMDKKGSEIYLVECSPAIMTQVNLVNNFIGSGSILSFYAPYFCSGCDTEKMLLIETEEALKNMPFRAPTCRCDQCDHTMDFDDIESSYFAFLSTVNRKPMDAALAESVNKFASESEGKLRTRSSSMPVVPSGATGSGSGPGVGSFPGHSAPTTPGSKDLKSLISESISFNQPEFTTQKPSAETNKILYLVIALLVVAIALLGYVVLRAT